MSAPADTLPCIERGQRIKSSSDSKLQYLLDPEVKPEVKDIWKVYGLSGIHKVVCLAVPSIPYTWPT